MSQTVGYKTWFLKKPLISSVSQIWPTENYLLQSVALLLSPANTRTAFISLLNILQMNWPRKHACIPIIYLPSKHKYVYNRMFCGFHCFVFKKWCLYFFSNFTTYRRSFLKTSVYLKKKKIKQHHKSFSKHPNSIHSHTYVASNTDKYRLIEIHTQTLRKYASRQKHIVHMQITVWHWSFAL